MEPDVEHDDSVGEVAEIIQEVMPALRSEIPPAYGNQRHRFGRVPQVVEMRRRAQNVWLWSSSREGAFKNMPAHWISKAN